MEIKEITVSKSVRVNTGNYEGTESFVSVKAVIDELDDHDAELVSLNAVAERALLAQLVRSYKVRGKTSMADPKKVAKHHGLTYIG